MIVDYPSRLRHFVESGAVTEERVNVEGCSDILITKINNTSHANTTEMLSYLLLLEEKEYHGLEKLDCSRPQYFGLSMMVHEPLFSAPRQTADGKTTLKFHILRFTELFRDLSITTKFTRTYDVHVQLRHDESMKRRVYYDKMHPHDGSQIIRICPETFISMLDCKRAVTLSITVPSEFVDDWCEVSVCIERAVCNTALRRVLMNYA